MCRPKTLFSRVFIAFSLLARQLWLLELLRVFQFVVCYVNVDIICLEDFEVFSEYFIAVDWFVTRLKTFISFELSLFFILLFQFSWLVESYQPWSLQTKVNLRRCNKSEHHQKWKKFLQKPSSLKNQLQLQQNKRKLQIAGLLKRQWKFHRID